MNIVSYLLASTYSGISPFLGASLATCKVNGQIVECPQWLGSAGWLFGLVWLAVVVLMLSANWKVFVKAGKPGWAIFIPIYNMIVLLQITRKPIWWIFLLFIPLVNAIIGIIIIHTLSVSFGKGVGFTLGLLFLPFIFYPILGFGKAQYS